MKHISEAKTMNAQLGFWHEWGPVMAFALLTGTGLYGLLLLASTPLAAFVLFALALGCSLAAGLAWWWSGRAS